MNDVFNIRAVGESTRRHAIIYMEHDDDVYNLRDARTGICRTSVNLDNLGWASEYTPDKGSPTGPC